MKRYLIYCESSRCLLYGLNNISMKFTTRLIAEEVASHFFKNKDNYKIIEIIL